MNLLHVTLLMADPKQPGSQWTSLAKDQKRYIDNIQKGDRLVTIAGIHGVVNKVNDDNTINLEVSPGSYIKIEKSAISLEWSNAINKAAK